MKPLSSCCKASVVTAHGCDSDSGHGGKPCNCTDGTQWYECSKCKNPCDFEPIYDHLRDVTKVYDESDRCPMCHKQPDEADGKCELCGDNARELKDGDKVGDLIASVGGKK